MKQLLGNSYYHDAQVVIGGYCVGKEMLLIDTGNDDSSVKKAIRDIENCSVIAIFNTHSHADHCGGNAYIQKQFKVATYAPVIESAFIENPILEPTYLYGASPLDELKNKFLFAKPSKVSQAFDQETSFTVRFNNGDHVFKLIPLKGHSPNMCGLVTPDRIAYLGDALLSEEMIVKHPLIFTYDVQNHLASLEALESLDAKGYVIAHGGFYESIKTLIQINKKALEDTQSQILDFVSQAPCTIDLLHQYLFEIYKISENVSLHFLNRSVIKAHVKSLVDSKQIRTEVVKGQLLLRI